jgi:hypothetical protein
MTGRDETPPSPEHAEAPVPQLIEQSCAPHETWMAQAEELARLRDEVRGSAEREAMEIVTAARRDIRQIVLEARRELFVLSAQVQAALGEGVPPAPQIGPPSLAPDDERHGADGDLSRLADEEPGVAPHSTVAAVLEEARRDIEVLDKDARAVPTRTVSPVPLEDFASEAPPVTAAAKPAHPPADATAEGAVTPEAAPGVRSKRFFAAVLVGVAIVALGMDWMLRGRGGVPDDAVATGDASATSVALPAQTGDGAPEPAERQAPVSVTLSLEALRPAWIRAIVDGRPDAGRMLRAGETQEFTGRSIALRVGDAGAVRVSVNGGEAVTLGRDGQVVNREFALDPSAAPSAPAEPPVPVEPTEPRGDPNVEPSGAGAAAVSSPSVEPLPAASAPLLSPEAAPAAVVSANERPSVPASLPTLERASTSGPSPESVLVSSAQRWLDAYHRQDRVTLSVLSTPDVAIVDERPTGERMPIAAGAIARTLERVNVRLAADTAILTGVMTERAVEGGLQRSSPVSLVWMSSEGSWRLSQARLVSQSALGQLFR